MKKNNKKSLVYVDNSNVWIEGMHVSAVAKGLAPTVYKAQTSRICDHHWKFDFGRLLHFAGGETDDIKRAVLFGSRPPKNDSLWAMAKKEGFEVVVYDRNINNKEKKIDTDIVATIMEDSFTIVNPAEDEIILIAGDKDYMPIEKVKKRGISIVVCFWGHCAKELKALGTYVNLDPYLNYLTLSK